MLGVNLEIVKFTVFFGDASIHVDGNECEYLQCDDPDDRWPELRMNIVTGSGPGLWMKAALPLVGDRPCWKIEGTTRDGATITLRDVDLRKYLERDNPFKRFAGVGGSAAGTEEASGCVLDIEEVPW